MKRLLALHHAVGHVGVFLSVLGVESRDLPVISTGSSVYCLQKVLGLEPCNQNKRSFNKGYVGVSSRQQPAAPQISGAVGLFNKLQTQKKEKRT